MKGLSVVSLVLDAAFSITLAAAINAILSGQAYGLYLFLCGFLFVFQSVVKLLYERQYVKEIAKREHEILLSYFDAPVPKRDVALISQIFDNDLQRCIDFETRSLPLMIVNVPLALFLFAIVSYHNAIFAGIILLLAAVEVSMPLLFNKSFAQNYERTAKVEEEIEGFYFGIIANIKKCWFIFSNYLSNRLRLLNGKYYEVGVRSEKTAVLYNNLLQIIDIAAQFGLYLIGAFLMGQFKYTVAEMVSLIYLGSKIMSVISDEATLMKTKSEYSAAKARIDAVHCDAQQKYKSVQSFSSVSYVKFKSPFLKQAFSFTIHSGDTWVIKGENGSGKSTLVRALMNTQDDYTGEVTIDGEDVRSVDMRDIVYYVPQDSVNISLSPGQLFKSCTSGTDNGVLEEFAPDMRLMDKPINTLSGGEQKNPYYVCIYVGQASYYPG